MNLLPGWYTDPHRQINLRWWVLAVRWWDGKVWTSFTADRRFGWVPTALVAAAGLWIWLVGVVMSVDLARDVAATPQPNQESWVFVSEWLPAIPAAGALTAALIAVLIRRRWQPVAWAAVTTFLWLSVAIAVVAVPKAP